MNFKTQTSSVIKQPVWALIILAFLLMVFGFIYKQYTKSYQTDIQSTSIETNISEQSKQELLRDLLHSSCPKDHDRPELYAQFLVRAVDGQFNIKDMLNTEKGSAVCAPGPFAVENSNTADLKQKTWELTSTPNFFVWRLAAESVDDADLYITNQNGFPIKSKSYTLNEQGFATLVLLPQAKLEPDTYYYLYLSQQNKNLKQRWIQPVSLVAQKASEAEELE